MLFCVVSGPRRQTTPVTGRGGVSGRKNHPLRDGPDTVRLVPVRFSKLRQVRFGRHGLMEGPGTVQRV